MPIWPLWADRKKIVDGGRSLAPSGSTIWLRKNTISNEMDLMYTLYLVFRLSVWIIGSDQRKPDLRSTTEGSTWVYRKPKPDPAHVLGAVGSYTMFSSSVDGKNAF